mmetsp:Transcript_23277/g.33232  ORF Transcript_23277/g.33232 Transcript_23277/m.33232 type:complete len:209 (-) Transcript_23277:676-1302(-)
MICSSTLPRRQLVRMNGWTKSKRDTDDSVSRPRGDITMIHSSRQILRRLVERGRCNKKLWKSRLLLLLHLQWLLLPQRRLLHHRLHCLVRLLLLRLEVCLAHRRLHRLVDCLVQNLPHLRVEVCLVHRLLHQHLQVDCLAQLLHQHLQPAVYSAQRLHQQQVVDYLEQLPHQQQVDYSAQCLLHRQLHWHQKRSLALEIADDRCYTKE